MRVDFDSIPSEHIKRDCPHLSFIHEALCTGFHEIRQLDSLNKNRQSIRCVIKLSPTNDHEIVKLASGLKEPE